ncbi:hypothetical protein, partial [uncultured Paracoccus sp.]|uniref:hypothetical protein n=1 Tax=uncultured Paracoccus sp. TaxID=189685 RepID=UPI0025FE8A73
RAASQHERPAPERAGLLRDFLARSCRGDREDRFFLVRQIGSLSLRTATFADHRVIPAIASC